MSSKIAVYLLQSLFGLVLLLGGNLAHAQCSGDLKSATVLTQTNLDGINTNEVVAYYRNADGTLCEAGRYATGGGSSVAAVMNEGKNSVLLTGNCLLVTNAGPSSLLDLTGSMSSFRVETDRLTLAGKVPSRGLIPISVTVRGPNGYVVNQLSNSINAFSIDPATCAIAERPNSLRVLNRPALGVLGNPAQIQFTPDGKFLVVTDRQYPGVGLLRHYAIHVLPVGSDGLAAGDIVNDADGVMPYGFEFDAAGHLLVSNAGEPFLGLSSLTAYSVNPDGTLAPLNGGQVFAGGQSGACWVSYTTHTIRPTAYVMSLIGAVISSYTVGADGSLTLLDEAAARGSNLVLLDGLDTALSEVSADSPEQYLYAINTSPAGLGGIVAYRVERNSALTQLGPILQGPAVGFSGLAAR